jgi:hypothetical protein
MRHTRGTAYASGWPQGHVARLPRTQNRAPALRGPQHRTEYACTDARFATCRRRTRGGAQRKREHSRTPWGRREWAAHQGGTGPLAASPHPRGLGCGRAAGSTPQRAHASALRSRRGQRPHIDSSAPDMPERCAGGLPGGWWYMTAVDSIGRYGLFFTSGLHRSARWLLPKPPKLEATKRHPVGHPPIDPETPCMGLRGSVGG